MTEPVYEYVKGKGWVASFDSSSEKLHPRYGDKVPDYFNRRRYWYLVNEEGDGRPTNWHDEPIIHSCPPAPGYTWSFQVWDTSEHRWFEPHVRVYTSRELEDAIAAVETDEYSEFFGCYVRGVRL